jgi:branched-chain amino acid transport system ATP-binding protein
VTVERVLQTTDLHAGYLPGVNILNGCDLRDIFLQSKTEA